MVLILLNAFYVPNTLYTSFEIISTLVYATDFVNSNKRGSWCSEQWNDLWTLVHSVSAMENFVQLQSTFYSHYSRIKVHVFFVYGQKDIHTPQTIHTSNFCVCLIVLTWGWNSDFTSLVWHSSSQHWAYPVYILDCTAVSPKPDSYPKESLDFSV